jgi:hypothetical protein
VILNGPSIYVGNPFYKCANSNSKSKGDFQEIDITIIPEFYIPRCNYIRKINYTEFRQNIPELHWDPTKRHSDVYRIAFRKMLSKPMERTLVASIIPPGFSHVDGIESLACESEEKLLACYPLVLSLAFDFLIKASDHSNFRESHLKFLPFVDVGDTAKHRALRLTCLSNSYASLWDNHAHSLSPKDWSSSDPRLLRELPHLDCRATWSCDAALRSAYARRFALVEIDVLVAMSLGLTLDQLVEIYRTMFPVLEENERGTWYDMSGQIVWTCSKGLSNTGFITNAKKPSEADWKETFAGLSGGSILECEVEIDFLPTGTRRIKRSYVAPFVTCDREADYRRAWAFFGAHGQQKAS